SRTCPGYLLSSAYELPHPAGSGRATGSRARGSRGRRACRAARRTPCRTSRPSRKHGWPSNSPVAVAGIIIRRDARPCHRWRRAHAHRVRVRARVPCFAVMAKTNEESAGGLRRALGLVDAVGIGVGAIVGAGIFVVTGVAAGVAGPAFLVGLLLAGAAAAANALSSAQLA